MPEQAPESGVSDLAVVELLFFAYRDFTADPDAILGEIGFGRAHHRVIHFVGSRPGMSVADLLDIL
ncbi:MAG: helix-turn-helix domain-containing protein, partial [Martelella sp.]